MNSIEKYRQSQQKLFEYYEINPQSKFVEAEGPIKKIHYLEIGQGDPLILLHGGGSHTSEWVPILNRLSQQFHCYVVDRPGCGLSDTINYRGSDYQKSAVDFIDSFMKALQLKKALFLGNSMGGYFSICFALKRPEKVQKLALIGAPAGMTRYIPIPLRLLGTSGINRFIMDTVGKPSPSKTRNLHKQLIVADIQKVPDIYLENAFHCQLLPDTGPSFLSLLECVVTLKGFKKELLIDNQLKELKMPVHFIWGDKDVFEKPESGQPKAATIPKHTFDVVKNAGHLPWLDQADECAFLIIKRLI